MRKKAIFVVILTSISLFLMVFGGILGYSSINSGIKLRYSSLTSYDGTQLAILIAEPSKENVRFDDKYGVVVAHGIISKAEGNFPLIHELVKAGFTVVALDERGHGNSGGKINQMHLGEKEYQDVVRCAEYLKEDLDCKKVCLVGHSMGGMAVTMASIWAEEEDIVDISGTVAISVASREVDPDASLGGTGMPNDFFSKTFNVDIKFAEFEKDMEISGPPYNYLVVISENDALIPIKSTKALCNLAGGPNKDNATDFAAMNASDIFVVKKEDNAPDHGGTPRDPRVVGKAIDWIERSMDISNHYDFDEDSYKRYWENNHNYFAIGIYGVYLMLVPLYILVSNKILIINKRKTIEPVKNTTIVNAGNSSLFKLVGVSALAIFISPMITALLKIPVLQMYIVVNVLVRDLTIATALILLLLFLLKFEKFQVIFNSNNMKRFVVSVAGAGVMLSFYILGMNIFDTFYDVNYKWMPFTFNPFILQRFIMFISLFVQTIFIMGVIEYICRKKIQDQLFKAKERFSIITFLKTAITNGILKGFLITILVIGIFLWYDVERLPALFNLSLLSIYTLMILAIVLFIIIDFFLTIFYQHSKDFWFVILSCYGYFVIFVSSWLIRI